MRTSRQACISDPGQEHNACCHYSIPLTSQHHEQSIGIADEMPTTTYIRSANRQQSMHPHHHCMSATVKSFTTNAPEPVGGHAYIMILQANHEEED